MSEAFASLNNFESFFALSPVVGGIFFLVRLVMKFSGIDRDGDLDGVHNDPDASFRLLSMEFPERFVTYVPVRFIHRRVIDQQAFDL